MSTKPFVFSSTNLPKSKAKQLNRAFPFLKLATAQEATAKALGYASWYECCHRGTIGSLSSADQDAGLSERVVRYYQQANALIGFGMSPSDADCWVRAWGLTGRPTMSPEFAKATFYVWDKALGDLESGVLNEEDFDEEFGDGGYSKYPAVDRPQRVTAGVILGPMGKYPHYAIDPAINAQISIYIRGPYSLYHCEDGDDVLAVYAPNFPNRKGNELKLGRLSDVQYEWHHGRKHPEAPSLVIPNLIVQAQANPDALIVLANRAMPIPGGELDFEHRAVACISGRDFVEFLQNKGAVNSSAVVWFHDVERSDTLGWCDWMHMGASKLPVFDKASKYKAGLPIYSYPFMSSPMAECEYIGFEECICLLPLNENYANGSDDDDGGHDTDGPDAPLQTREVEDHQFA